MLTCPGPGVVSTHSGYAKVVDISTLPRKWFENVQRFTEQDFAAKIHYSIVEAMIRRLDDHETKPTGTDLSDATLIPMRESMREATVAAVLDVLDALISDYISPATAHFICRRMATDDRTLDAVIETLLAYRNEKNGGTSEPGNFAIVTEAVRDSIDDAEFDLLRGTTITAISQATSAIFKDLGLPNSPGDEYLRESFRDALEFMRSPRQDL